MAASPKHGSPWRVSPFRDRTGAEPGPVGSATASAMVRSSARPRRTRAAVTGGRGPGRPGGVPPARPHRSYARFMTDLQRGRPTTNSMRRALKRARDGVALDVTEAAVLLQARGDDLTDLAASAARVRDAGLEAAGRPGVITYSRKVFIPLTRLCRDKCHYCTFVTVPGKLRRAGHGMFLSPDEVLDIARRGAAMGCKEALFTLGDRPEDRWPEAREWLDAHGYDDTLAYVRAMAIRVLEETGLLPHLNPGVLTWTDLQRLKPVAPVHGHDAGDHGDPPVVRARRPAPRLARTRSPPSGCGCWRTRGAPTSRSPPGILIGIGETYEERADSLFALRRIARAYHGIQEVIVQNFRAKPDTAMRGMPDAELEELAAAVAVARHILGPVRPHPGAAEPRRRRVRAAHRRRDRRLGRCLPAHPRPRQPRAALAADRRAGRRSTAAVGLRRCANGSPSTRSSSSAASPGSTPGCCRTSARSPTRRRASRARTPIPAGLPWQEPDEGFTASGRTDLHRTIDTEGRTGDRRDDFDEVYGDWEALREAGRARHGAGPHRRRRAGRAGARPPTTRRSSPTTRRSRCCTPTARRWTRCAGSPTTCAGTWSATTSPTSSPGTSTSPTSATPAAASAPSPSAAPTPTPTPCPWTRSPTGPQQAWDVGRGRGVHAGRHPPRPARHRVLRHRAGGEGARARHACARLLARWRSSTARPAPGCPSGTG